MKKNRIRMLVVILCILTTSLMAQTKSNNVGFGFNISQVQNDFGIGLDIISPYFAKSKIAVRVGGNFKWLEHLENEITTWTPYQNIQIGIRGRQFIVEDKLNIYGEGGSMIIFPNNEFSSENTIAGGYGLFGFEFKPSEKFGFYLELGGVGTGAIADKLATKPIYSNGFISTVGFRITP